MSSSSSLCSSSFTFQSCEFSSSSISNRLARWCEIFTELELSLYNRTSRRNDKAARGDEMVLYLKRLKIKVTDLVCQGNISTWFCLKL